jgi:hypothetical protein
MPSEAIGTVIVLEDPRSRLPLPTGKRLDLIIVQFFSSQGPIPWKPRVISGFVLVSYSTRSRRRIEALTSV